MIPKVTVLVPCYNEEKVIAVLVCRLTGVLNAIGGENEILMLDDGSTDLTWSEIVKCSESDKRIKGIRLSRNFGHQAAITAGFAESSGDRILIIDADLQDPPELLLDMINLMNATQADVVYGCRSRREGESIFKKTTAKIFYWALSKLSDYPIPRDTGDFRLITRRVADAFLAMDESCRYIRGMISWIGFKQIPINYVREKRVYGKTKYPLGKMLQFAIDAVTSFSIRPLRMAVILSVFLLMIALGLAVKTLIAWNTGDTVRGWTSLMSTVLFVGAMHSLLIGIVGEYLGRIFIEVKRRPKYFVRERVNQIFS